VGVVKIHQAHASIAYRAMAVQPANLASGQKI
jgi:hypothetical protein